MKSDMPSILVIGATGQVGNELMRALAPLGMVTGAALEGGDYLHVDLGDPRSLQPLLERQRPDVLINAAAYTAVDKAESEAGLAQRINCESVAAMGRWAAAAEVPLVHYSTDFVFDGGADRPYREEDPAEPVSVYGRTKLAGEQALAASGAPHLVFRTSWVYGNHGANFMHTMLRLAAERDELRVVDDQTGAPTWSRMLAEVTAQVVGRVLHGDLDMGQIQGLYHLTAAGSTSWYGFARAILEHSGLDCRLEPIPTSDYPTPAARPAYSVLDNSRLRDRFGLQLPDWRLSLAQCMGERS